MVIVAKVLSDMFVLLILNVKIKSRRVIFCDISLSCRYQIHTEGISPAGFLSGNAWECFSSRYICAYMYCALENLVRDSLHGNTESMAEIRGVVLLRTVLLPYINFLWRKFFKLKWQGFVLNVTTFCFEKLTYSDFVCCLHSLPLPRDSLQRWHEKEFKCLFHWLSRFVAERAIFAVRK